MRHPTSSERIDVRLAAVASKQHGVFSFEQLVEAGGDPWLVRRRISSGRWLRLSPRVYAFAGSPLSFQGRVIAGCLSAGDWSFASHRTAAELWLPTDVTP